MSSFAHYDVLHSFKDIHKVGLNLADELNGEQLNRKPEGYSTSIGWHLARESDYLKAAFLHHYPGLALGYEEEGEIWIRENLAQKWGFPVEARETVGTGLSDGVAAALRSRRKFNCWIIYADPTMQSRNLSNGSIRNTRLSRMWTMI